MWNSNRASPKKILSEDAILKMLFINKININVILKLYDYCYLLLFYFWTFTTEILEIFSFFSEHAVTPRVMSFQFIPTVGIASYLKEPTKVTTETCPLIILWHIHRINTMPDDFINQTRVCCDHPTFIGVINLRYFLTSPILLNS